MIVYEYDLDMVPGLTQGRTVVSLSQYDDNFFINFHLYTRNGSFVIESGTTARIRGTKPDGNGFSATATVDASDMTVLVEGDKQMTAAAGTSQYELTLMKGTKELNTANFDVYIERAALDIDTPASETKLRELYDLPVDEILQAATTAVDAKDDAEDARDAAIAAKDEAVSVTDGLMEIVRGSFIYETASGSMASFPDGGDGLPVKNVSVDVDPVQDLHGYTKPWPGGAGKNLAENLAAVTQTVDGVTYTPQADGSIKCVGTITGQNTYNLSSQPIMLAPGNYKLDAGADSSVRGIRFVLKINNSNTSSTRYIDVYGANGTSTTIAEGEYIKLAYLRGNYTNEPVNATIYPMIRLSSTSAGYEPYSNICPITGHTSAAITRMGKNLCDNSDATTQTVAGVTYTPQTDGSIKCVGTITGQDAYYLKQGRIDLPPGNYIFSASGASANGIRLVTSKMNANGTVAQWVNIYNEGEATITVSEGQYFYSLYLRGETSGTAVNVTIKPMIRLASDPAGFEPYQGQTYNVTFPTAAGTVYGGTLDLNAGRLTVDRANIASYSGQSINTPWLSSMDEYAAGRTPTTGAQVVYPLTTPITYNLTAEEITTLLGINHIWADTGDVSVEYAADPKLYINKVIANALNA